MLDDPEAFMEWANHAVAGLKDSVVMLGILDDRADTPARMAFALQIGHCILSDKPIILMAPHGTRISETLRACATAVVEYDPLDWEGARPAIAAALRKVVRQ